MLTARDAESIARKLGADFKEKSRRHKIAIRVKGKEVGRFGIRRGSGDLAHDYIPQQIHVSRAEAEDIAGCRLYLGDYEQILKKKQLYPS